MGSAVRPLHRAAFAAGGAGGEEVTAFLSRWTSKAVRRSPRRENSQQALNALGFAGARVEPEAGGDEIHPGYPAAGPWPQVLSPEEVQFVRLNWTNTR